MLVSLRGGQKWTELGGLKSGLPNQHRGTDLYQQQQPAAGCRRPRVTDSRPIRRGRGPRARPDSVPDRQPGPQTDLSRPIDVHTECMEARSKNISGEELKMFF